ncbi:hypothetical protein T4B_8399 [Trichinella pseudospiralis]|uniref:Uncharacterized protein n=1 Tax=Trichinella pseudospiralis TaxID=6337 RepID=A0A0V1IH05_TRIPS|nr:hypothetical protein T4B_8399 [Trichinella pseudospiralis]KRZ36413.1 hypothetical protein T4C_9507 [Trichinella pseudospiralis]
MSLLNYMINILLETLLSIQMKQQLLKDVDCFALFIIVPTNANFVNCLINNFHKIRSKLA